MLAEAVVLELCSSGGLDRNIEFVKGALRARRDALVEALNEQIPEAEFVVPGGGYFLGSTSPLVPTRQPCLRRRKARVWPSSPVPIS